MAVAETNFSLGRSKGRRWVASGFKSAITTMLQKQNGDGKLFVGGLLKETSELTLKKHFSQYGPVKECKIIKYWNNCVSRGFGFVKFDEPSHAHQALECRNPTIDGKSVEVKPATEMRSHTLKIFVGGLAYNLTDQDFKKYFEGFGKVEEAVLMRDKKTGDPRGFGFITFDSEVAVDNVLQKQFHELGNKRVEVKRAIPKNARYSIYNANKTRLELGFGRDMSMLSNGSGCDLPWVNYDSEGNRYYNRGLHYHYCPSPIPLRSCNYAATHFHGSNTCTGRWIHGDHAKYSSPVYTKGVVDENVGNKVRADHAYPGPKDSSQDISSRSNGNDDSKEAEVLFMESNGLDNHIKKSSGLDNHNVSSRSKGIDDSKEAEVMRDKKTGDPREFGYITFDSEVAVDNVLQKQFHELGNKRVEVKRAIPKNTRYNIYNANKTRLELGFGRDMSMLSNGSGCELPWVYYDSEGNRYYIRGLHYYYCPSPIPLHSCNYAATHFHGSNTCTGRWIHDDHSKYSSPVYTNGGVDENVGNKMRPDHAYPGPKDSSQDISSGSNGNDDSKEAEVLFMESNGLDNHIKKSSGLDNHNVSSRSKGIDDSKEAEVMFMESNGLDNHITESNGPMGEGQYSPSS